MNDSAAILQIVPRAPGTQDGVGDYAFTVARQLRDLHSHETIFAAAKLVATVAEADGFPDGSNNFETMSIATLGRRRPALEFAHMILHYVNYGYQKRGVPFGLLSILRELRQRSRGRLLTIFHEISASGPPWKSAFWLRPCQRQIAKSIARLSDACIVSSDVMFGQLKVLAPGADISVHPVFSNFGEASLSADQLANRSSHRWVICGGTALVQRSLESFRAISNRIPKQFRPDELFVVGGRPNRVIDSLLSHLNGIRSSYRPEIAASEASRILSESSFAWLDYFHRKDVPAAVVLKSTAFAAACAHGVVPIFPHASSVISIENDCLPGPYFADRDRVKFPEDRAKAAAEIYDWYQRHTASRHLVRGIAGALGIAPAASRA